MKVEIRDNSVHIEGYVNAVERDSKVLSDYQGQFIEKIQAGAFQRSLDRDGDVPVLLNHDSSYVLATPSEAQVYEDAVGLRAVFDTSDPLVVEKARDGKLSGWSFGFMSLRESRDPSSVDGIAHRYIRELVLREVSLLDDTKTPAYIATSVEVRDDAEGQAESLVEVRAFDDHIEYVKAAPEEEPEIKDDFYKFENRYYNTFIH